MVNMRSRASLLIFALSLSLLNLMAGRVAAQTETRNHWKWEWTDDGWKRLLEIRGKAEFTDDYSDIQSLSEGGSVRIEETRNGTTRKLDITRAANGQLQRAFYLNGQARALDAEARAWVAGILLEAVRQSALDADKRVERIYARRGLSGVLEEISLSKGDYARRIYFEALLKNGRLNASALQTVLREVARRISSDYDKGKILIAVANDLTGRGEALAAFFEAVSTIKSDHDRKLVLSAALKKNPSNRELLLGVVKAAATLSSGYEKSLVLKEAVAFEIDSAALADAFFQSVGTISSDYERRGVLSALLKKGNLSREVLSRMLEQAARFSSDYEKATFLLEALSAYAGDARLRGAFIQTAETIKSDYERGRVLSALTKR